MNPASVAKSVSETYAEFGLELRYESLPTEVISKAKDHILDTIGCGLAGCTMEWSGTIRDVAKDLGGPPQATVLGDGAKVAAANAALACGTACSSLDYDDTGYWVGAVHSSRALVPTSLAVAEWMGRSGKDLIKATIVGWEVANRVGNAQGLDRDRKYDLTAIYKVLKRGMGSCNQFGAAAEAGLLMGLNRDQISSAIALATCLDGPTSGILQSHREGADAIPFSMGGWTAHAAIMAAILAQKGLIGPRLIFEGDKGFFNQMDLGDLYAPERLTEQLGQRWYTLDNCIKFYPSGHGIHHWIESLKTVMHDSGVGPDNVEEVICHVPKNRAELHFEFPEQKLNPNPYNSRFSLPYILASVLIDGDWNITSSLGGKVTEPRRLGLAKRVHHHFEEDSWIEVNRGTITVKTKDGKSYKAKHPLLLGLPSNPPSHQQIVDKFRNNVSLALPRAATDALLQSLENLDRVNNVAEVMRLTVPQRA